MSDLSSQMQVPTPIGSAPSDPKPPRRTRKPRAASAPKPARKKRKQPARFASLGKKAKAAPKQVRRGRADVMLDLGGAVALIGSMHRTDVPVFRVMSEALTARGKPSRKRLLAALNKVFG